MPLPPKVESATIRYEDGSFLSLRPNGDDKTMDGTYWSAPDAGGARSVIARMPKVPGVWGALIGVAAMAGVDSDG